MNVEKTTSVLFEKRTVAELTDDEMINVDGGTSTFVLASSELCPMAGVPLFIYLTS